MVLAAIDSESTEKSAPVDENDSMIDLEDEPMQSTSPSKIFNLKNCKLFDRKEEC
jgi:hypothetical protein